MLRLPSLEVAEPTTIQEAVDLLHRHGDQARVMAGGTDLLPNMKHEITTPGIVVGLWRVDGLTGVRIEDGALRIGAMTTLHALSKDPLVLAHAPALAEAAGDVAGPQLRRMGTIGGNVCLDTRCVYINQTYFWRQALGFCLKKDGTKCHVVEGGRRCVAAASNDSAPVLMALGASLVVQSHAGARVVAIDDFYTTDGVFNQARRHDEVVTAILVPLPKPGTIMGYAKLRTRAAIDFPELGVAVLARTNGDGIVEHADVCITALGSRPIHVKGLEPHYTGKKLDASVIGAIADAAHQRAKPLTNIASDPSYRREMVPVFVRRAFKRAMM
ncbi:FAD binding domain-containing protein, partial [Myxococcota bacterium]|nr:FAD binding domain-containing protein [Myxococcota bacterium]